MSTEQHTRPAPPPAHPHPDLRRLDALVGTWTMTGRDHTSDAELSGTHKFEWLEGGFYLLQHTEGEHFGQKVRGLEVIGYDYEREAVTSRYYDSGGNGFEYTWEREGDTLTIWMGTPDSPAFFSGVLPDGGDTITGQWQWPGGGYDATITRH